jgi:hypothetical protein
MIHRQCKLQILLDTPRVRYLFHERAQIQLCVSQRGPVPLPPVAKDMHVSQRIMLSVASYP